MASSMNVHTMRKRPAAGMYLQQASRRVSKVSLLQLPGHALWQDVAASWLTLSKDNSLFYRVRRGIQPLLDLVRLLPELFQRTWIIRCVCPARSSKPVILRTEIITRRAPYLSHGRCSAQLSSAQLMQRKNCYWQMYECGQRRALCKNSSWRRKEGRKEGRKAI